MVRCDACFSTVDDGEQFQWFCQHRSSGFLRSGSFHNSWRRFTPQEAETVVICNVCLESLSRGDS